MANVATLKFSRHALERYSERIMDKETKFDINKFIIEHQEKIENDITKMIQYSTLLYSGKPVSEIYDKKPVEIWQNGLWIIIIDIAKNNVVTLYSLDLGVGDEMNQLYMNSLVDKIKRAKQNLEEVKAEIELQADGYRDAILQNEAIINERRREIKELEACNDSYRGVIDGLQIKVTAADREVRDVVAKFIGKKIF